MQIRLMFPDGTSCSLDDALSREVMEVVWRVRLRRLRELRRQRPAAVSRILTAMRQKEREERRAER